MSRSIGCERDEPVRVEFAAPRHADPLRESLRGRVVRSSSHHNCARPIALQRRHERLACSLASEASARGRRRETVIRIPDRAAVIASQVDRPRVDQRRSGHADRSIPGARVSRAQAGLVREDNGLHPDRASFIYMWAF
jgi:hypothetical protein